MKKTSWASDAEAFAPIAHQQTDAKYLKFLRTCAAAFLESPGHKVRNDVEFLVNLVKEVSCDEADFGARLKLATEFNSVRAPFIIATTSWSRTKSLSTRVAFEA